MRNRKERVLNLKGELVVVELNDQSLCPHPSPYANKMPWHKSQVKRIRRGVCKICGSELYRPLGMQILMHPKTGECPRWEHGQEYDVMGDGRKHYMMGPIQMSDLEPYAYKWSFQK
jgi:hypothetical protein